MDKPTIPQKPTFDKRYWLFRYSSYEASGGMSDFYDSYDTIEEAQTHITPGNDEWGHVWDSHILKIVSEVVWFDPLSEVEPRYQWVTKGDTHWNHPRYRSPENLGFRYA